MGSGNAGWELPLRHLAMRSTVESGALADADRTMRCDEPPRSGPSMMCWGGRMSQYSGTSERRVRAVDAVGHGFGRVARSIAGVAEVVQFGSGVSADSADSSAPSRSPTHGKRDHQRPLPVFGQRAF